MEQFLIDMKGKFYIEELSALPVWSSTDERRIVLVVNGSEKNLYFATDTGWSKLTPAPSSAVTNLRLAVFDGTTGAIKQGHANAYIDASGYLYADRVYNEIWNDIADFIDIDENVKVEPGKVYIIDENEEIKISFDYCQAGIIGIASDTYGFALGVNQKAHKLPVCIGGFALAYVDRLYLPGTPLTTSQNGYLTKIEVSEKLTYPERIVATFFKKETSKSWNGIEVNGRHWVKVI